MYILEFNDILENLPKEHNAIENHYRKDFRKFWSNGCDILCEDEDTANIIGDFLENLGFESINTGYYDPEEDKRNNEIDDCTGFYYVTCD